MSLSKDIKICAGIVTFNPDIPRLKENYLHIVDQVDIVIICDNGSNNINQIKNEISGEKINIIELENNMGIAYALNKLCQCAIKMNYNWILTLDQDSVCPNNIIKALNIYCNKEVAIVGPRILYKSNEEYSAHSIYKVEKVDWVITSGSLTSLDVWKKIGGFDDTLFIDKVDTDYGIRANKAGFTIVRNNSVVLNHELGALKCKKIFGRVVYVTNYNSKRIYYQTRNSIYIFKKNKFGNPFIDILKIFIKVLLFECDKIKKTKSVFKGILDGLKLKVQ